jgi:tetratricopeptide (TPR) repeat protein
LIIQGIENYKNYLEICQKTDDVHGEATACNCLGVNYMLLAWKASDEGFLNGFKASEKSLAHIDKAIEFHQQHANIADAGGKFVANVNLGLCYGVKGEFTTAAKHQQSALRIAIKMQTLFGQSIVVGNLGMLATAKADFATARTCYEQVSIKRV